MIEKISNEIRYSNSSVEEIFNTLCMGKCFEKLSFLSLCKENMKHMNFPEAFKSAAEKSRGSLSLNAEDFLYIYAFFDELGTTDTEGQLKNCQSYKLIFDGRAASALSDLKQKGKMYCSVFFLCGIAALIIAL